MFYFQSGVPWEVFFIWTNVQSINRGDRKTMHGDRGQIIGLKMFSSLYLQTNILFPNRSISGSILYLN